MVLLLFLLSACTPARVAIVEQYPELAEYDGLEVDEVEFVGAEPYSADSLDALVDTFETHCSLGGIPICIPWTDIGKQEGFVSLSTLQQDVARLALFYRRSGFFGTRVRPEIEPVEAEPGEVVVRFVVERGDSIMLDTLEVTGLAGILDGDSMAATLPLRPGELFDLSEFDVSAATVRQALLRRGHAYAEVLRNYGVDTVANVAVATIEAVPGPRVVVDSILVDGLVALERSTALRQLTFRAGDLLETRELGRSQRNLYSLDVIRLATVTVAPDSLQSAPADSTRATVIVQIAEAPVHVVEAAVGYGTTDCLRSETSWTSRSFLGDARTLAISGSVSKVGAGEPVDFGSACLDATASEFGGQIDYLASIDLTQPYLFGPANRLNANLYAERRSEANIYEREALGGRVGVNRQLSPGRLLTLSLEAARVETDASPAIFCITFDVCDPRDIVSLGIPQWRNTIGVSLVQDRTDRPLDPTRGHILRTGLTWASDLLASDLDYLRWSGDGSLYRSVRRGWVAVGHLRLAGYMGLSLVGEDAEFLPPDQRLFAGGASSIRGYGRNQVGPGVYIPRPGEDVIEDTVGGMPVFSRDRNLYDFVPTGGTGVGVANVELRFPSPFRPDLLRLAGFVDAGAVSPEGLSGLRSAELRITPGAGLRLRTPVGPVRIDVAYNFEGVRSAPLYVPDIGRDVLRLVDPDFQPDDTFWSHLRLHLAVGQAF